MTKFASELTRIVGDEGGAGGGGAVVGLEHPRGAEGGAAVVPSLGGLQPLTNIPGMDSILLGRFYFDIVLIDLSYLNGFKDEESL